MTGVVASRQGTKEGTTTRSPTLDLMASPPTSTVSPTYSYAYDRVKQALHQHTDRGSALRKGRLPAGGVRAMT